MFVGISGKESRCRCSQGVAHRLLLPPYWLWRRIPARKVLQPHFRKTSRGGRYRCAPGAACLCCYSPFLWKLWSCSFLTKTYATVHCSSGFSINLSPSRGRVQMCARDRLRIISLHMRLRHYPLTFRGAGTDAPQGPLTYVATPHFL